MSTISDEMRTAMQCRAAQLQPAPGLLEAVERRASRIRRQRIAAACAGTTLTVAAVVGLAPTVQSTFTPRPAPIVDYAAPAPSPAGEPDVEFGTTMVDDHRRSAAAGTLDVLQPWELRGEQALVNDSTLAAIRDQHAARNDLQAEQVKAHVLFATDQATSGPLLVYLAHPAGDISSARWGVFTPGTDGGQVLHEAALTPDTTALIAALPGRSAPLLLVLAAPSTGQISYDPGSGTFAALSSAWPGVALVELQGDTSRDAVQVLDGNGDLDAPLFQGPAPDYLR